MPSTNITQFKLSNVRIHDYFTAQYSHKVPDNLLKLFRIAMRDKSLFPNINIAQGATYENYIDRWVQSYLDADNNPARNRSATPKGSVNDPAIRAIVKMVTQVSDEEAMIQESHHNLFMSAENVQGALLEEYIDSVISGSDFNWIWCKGNTLQSVDFCTPDGVRLLQIKNKFNSENSSSSRVRLGTKIEKWYRLGTRTVAGRRVPDYKWDDLNNIIESASGMPCYLCEEDYVAYVEEVAINNPELITDQ